MRTTLLFIVFCVALTGVSLPAACDTTVAEAVIPRIALVGDSWSAFLWAFRTFRDVLQEYPAFENYVETGASTAVMGIKTYEYLDSDRMQAMEELLNENPTIDVVVLALGANDFLSGTPVETENPEVTKADWRCPGTEREYNDALFTAIGESCQAIIDRILAIRPDIRIVIPSYTYSAIDVHSECGAEPQNRGWAGLGLAMQQLANANERVEFVNNYGLMQWHYGVYTTAQEEDESTWGAPDIPAQDSSLLYPVDILTEALVNTGNPGGLPQYRAPRQAYIDREGHPTEESAGLLVQRMMDTHIEQWLRYPKVFEIRPLDASDAQARFQLTFSETVSGFDASDMSVVAQDVAGTTKDARVLGITPADAARIYTVTIDTTGLTGGAGIHIFDDDSIVAQSGLPLGGPNTATWTDNGAFSYNGAFSFTDLTTPDPSDFQGALTFLAAMTEPYEELINNMLSFSPDKLDINSNFTDLLMSFLTGSVSLDTLYISGNYLLESYEFALIHKCLSDSNFDLSSVRIPQEEEGTTLPGPSHAAVMSAWQQDITQMQADLGGRDQLALQIFAGLDTLFAGYMMLGDQDSLSLMQGLSAILSAMANEIEKFLPGVSFSEITANNYSGHPEWFSSTADPDGDGYSNAAEYLHFQSDGPDAYADAALNSSLHPLPLKQWYEVSEKLRLYIPELLPVSTTYQWYKDGIPIQEDAAHTGTQTRTLNIPTLSLSDAGAYHCVYNQNIPEGEKAEQTYGPIQIQVANELPAHSQFTLVLFALVITLLFAFRIYRVA